MHKESEEYRGATVQKLTDTSHYTVRFHDGDERNLRRSAVMPMGPSHFQEGATLGDFPLTDPDTFGTAATAESAGAGDSGRKRRRISDGSEGGLGSGDRGRLGTGDVLRTYGNAANPTGKYHESVLVNPRPGDLEDENGHWWPGLVVPAAEVMRDMINSADYDPKTSSVVRFFEDNLYAIVEHKYMRIMKHNTIPLERFKKDHAFMSGKAAKRAFAYMENAKLPPSFKWKTWSDKCDLEALGDLTENSEELYFEDDRDKGWHPRIGVGERFTDVFTKWMAAAGTPIKRTPSVGFKDLNLYKLFTLVYLEGGHKEVSKKKVWKHVYARLTGMSLERVPQSADKTMLTAYEKYLLAFSDSNAADEFKAFAEDTKVMKTPQMVTPAEEQVSTPAEDKLTKPPPAYHNPGNAAVEGAAHDASAAPAQSGAVGGGGSAGATAATAAASALAAAAGVALAAGGGGGGGQAGTETPAAEAKPRAGRARAKGKTAESAADAEGAAKARGKGKGRGKRAATAAAPAASTAGAGASAGAASSAIAAAVTAAAAALAGTFGGGGGGGGDAAEGDGAAAGASADSTKGAAEYLYAVGSMARCKYKDGKRYLVRVEGREMRTCIPEEEPHPSDGVDVVHYLIHFHNWHKKFDAWVPYYQIFPEADGGSKRKPRGRAKREKDDAAGGGGGGARGAGGRSAAGSADTTKGNPASALTAAALAAFNGEPASAADPADSAAAGEVAGERLSKRKGMGRWPNGKAAKAKAAAAAAVRGATGGGGGRGAEAAETAEERNRRMKAEAGISEEGGPMTDEELARIIAGHEAAQAGRRRETRRSWNASLSVIKAAPPSGAKGRVGKTAATIKPPPFPADDTTEADIVAAVENAVGIKRKRGSAADVEEDPMPSKEELVKDQPPWSCSASSFLSLCKSRADKNCYTPSCRANVRYWEQNGTAADNDADAPARQAAQNDKLQQALKAVSEKSLQERIDFLKQRYAQHVKAVKAMKQQERAASKGE